MDSYKPRKLGLTIPTPESSTVHHKAYLISYSNNHSPRTCRISRPEVIIGPLSSRLARGDYIDPLITPLLWRVLAKLETSVSELTGFLQPRPSPKPARRSDFLNDLHTRDFVAFFSTISPENGYCALKKSSLDIYNPRAKRLRCQHRLRCHSADPMGGLWLVTTADRGKWLVTTDNLFVSDALTEGKKQSVSIPLQSLGSGRYQIRQQHALP